MSGSVPGFNHISHIELQTDKELDQLAVRIAELSE